MGRIEDLCTMALGAPAAEEKQYYLEEVLRTIGVDVEALREEATRVGLDVGYPGRAPESS